jgi:signal transduction histidine kinase
MNALLLTFIALLYLALLFYIAQRAEKGKKPAFLQSDALIYALSLGVYCTAWTFYGSIGRAAEHGIDFLTIYIGPLLMMPLWWVVTRKVIRIVNYQHISSLADFLAARYGKDQRIGILVALVCFFAITPYIALQIQAIAETMVMSSDSGDTFDWLDAGLISAIALCAFTIIYGARFLEGHRNRRGMVTAIAVESIIKLVAFLLVAGLLVYTFRDKITLDLLARQKDAYLFPKGQGMGNWIIMTIVSGFALLLLPRQFQVGVVEVRKERHLKTAMWVFPLYLFLINLFVIPLAILGKELLNGTPSDYYMLSLANLADAGWMMPVVYIGGFSAATSMIIVSAIALGGMVSTNLIMPAVLRSSTTKDFSGRILLIRRLSIVLVFLFAYAYQHWMISRTPLVSVGLTSFIGIAQLAPAFFGGLYWEGGTRKGAISGILAGVTVWGLLLIIPSVIATGVTDPLSDPNVWIGSKLFDHIGLDRIPGTALLSLSANAFVFVGVSLLTEPNATEKNQASVFLNIMKIDKGSYDRTGTWSATASFPDIKSLLIQFLGDRRTEEVLDRYARINNIDFSKQEQVDPKVISYAERLLTGAIGPASAKIMIAHVVDDEEISIEEVVDILTESRKVRLLNAELNQQREALERAGDELKKAYNQLQEYADIKNEFLYTVTHELRTPLTAIRSQAEILADGDVPEKDQEFFLNNIVTDCERLTTLITNVLDLERFESGNFQSDFAPVDIEFLVRKSADSLRSLAASRDIGIDLQLEDLPDITGDEDRLNQVLVNLISNAIKYSPRGVGNILVCGKPTRHAVILEVCDHGQGIAPEERNLIFDKFYQSRNQTKRKPQGSGLGLAICKNIVQMHNGTLAVTDRSGFTTCFQLKLPIQATQSSDPEDYAQATHR